MTAIDSLDALQEARESKALAAGRDDFLKQIDEHQKAGNFHLTQVGRELISNVLEPFEAAIHEWKPPVRRGPKGFGQVAEEWIAQVTPRVAAWFTLKTVIDGIARETDYRKVCLDVVEWLHLELRSQRLKEDAPEAYRVAKAQPKRIAAMRKMFPLVDTSDLDIPEEWQLQIGALLIDLLRRSTGMVEQGHVEGPLKSKKGQLVATERLVLKATPETAQQMNDRITMLAAYRPQDRPMMVPPLPWTPGTRGGYRYALRGRNSLVRRRHSIGRTRETTEWTAQLEQAPMPAVYCALNALQNTAWRINRAVWDVVQQRRIAGTDDLTKRILETAGDVLDHTIYFPYNLDWRGRIYPIPDALEPQGNDLAKALLTFAQGKPLTESGERWLANHGAKRLGKTPAGRKVSKMTISERVEWVRANTELLVRVADDFGNLWWTDTKQVDDPLQFYAFCVEWRDYTRAKERGETFVSTLPVSIDGSCNGLQHYSALFRDEEGGWLVNLAPWKGHLSDLGHQGEYMKTILPQDMYERVVENVEEQLNQRRRKDRLAAKILRAKLVTRKLVKQPVMSFFYSATNFAVQMYEQLKTEGEWKHTVATFGGGTQAFAALRTIEQCIKSAIEETTTKAFDGMKWFRKCASAIVNNGRSPEWMLPSGFAVRQMYPRLRETSVRTAFAGTVKIVKLEQADETKRDDPRHKRALAPNVIHSLDAAALVFTLASAAEGGADSFAAAHDCYTTLASDCALLAQAAAQAFSRVYTTHDPEAPAVKRGERTVMLEKLYRHFQAHADGADLTPPASGTLDLNVWLVSENLFS